MLFCQSLTFYRLEEKGIPPLVFLLFPAGYSCRECLALSRSPAPAGMDIYYNEVFKILMFCCSRQKLFKSKSDAIPHKRDKCLYFDM